MSACPDLALYRTMVRQPFILAGAGLLAIVVSAALTVQASAQASREQADKFIRFLGSETYATLVAQRALANDEAMPPRCKTRSISDRKIVAIPETPRFIATREVPVRGKWVERIRIARCGRAVDHNIFVSASRVRGLHAAAGFPGNSLTDIQLQLLAGRAVLRRAIARTPRSCKRVEIVNTRVLRKPASPGAPWAENWTVWACGKRLTQRIAFRPKPGGGLGFTLQ